SNRLALKKDEEDAMDAILNSFDHAGLAVPGVKEVLAGSGVDAVRAKNLLQVLLREKKLTKVGEDLIFHPAALSALRAMLAGKKGIRFTIAEFKDWTGASRKYAIPLLEYLDRERVTRREGEMRLIV
ncbi:MAG: SelB C-terminal domain-containing protein, partial [Bryobacteraceae bacterium]|nr:SelB C-terminal domain-containing protein [Bryobacteraceae bacterium]